MTVLQGEWKEQHNNQRPHLEHVDDGDEGEEEQGDDEEGEQEGGGDTQQQQDTRDSQVHWQQQHISTAVNSRIPGIAIYNHNNNTSLQQQDTRDSQVDWQQ